jgi:hypothetical protein
MSVKVWLGIPGGDYAAAVRFSGETLGHEVAFDARNIVDLTAGKGDRIQLFGPGHRYFEFYRNHGARIVPLLELDDPDQASAELARGGAELLGRPESDGTWTWRTCRMPRREHPQPGRPHGVAGRSEDSGRTRSICGRSAHFPFGTVCINIQTGPLHAGRPRVCWGAEIAKPSRGNRAPARRSAGTSIGSWSRRWPYGSGHFCACAWSAGLASPAWSSLAGVVYRRGVAWVHRSRAGIGSAGAARRAGAWKGPANYCVSWVTRSAVTSMTLTAEVGALS